MAEVDALNRIADALFTLVVPATSISVALWWILFFKSQSPNASIDRLVDWLRENHSKRP